MKIELPKYPNADFILSSWETQIVQAFAQANEINEALESRIAQLEQELRDLAAAIVVLGARDRG